MSFLKIAQKVDPLFYNSKYLIRIKIALSHSLFNDLRTRGEKAVWNTRLLLKKYKEKKKDKNMDVKMWRTLLRVKFFIEAEFP